MVKKIIHIVVCVIVVTLTVLSLLFVGLFTNKWNASVDISNDKFEQQYGKIIGNKTEHSDIKKISEKRYDAVLKLQNFETGKLFYDKFMGAGVNDIGSTNYPGKLYLELSDTVDAHQDICEAKEKQAQDFFICLSCLKSVKDDNFAEFKKNFPRNLKKLTVDEKCEQFTFGDKYIQEIKDINDYPQLVTYISENFSKEYTSFKKNQLKEKEQYNALKELLDITENVLKFVSNKEISKEEALSILQDQNKKYIAADSNLEKAVVTSSILIFLAFLSTIVFVIYTIITRFKDYRIITVIFGIFIIAFVCAYFIAHANAPSDVMSIPTYVKEGVSVLVATFNGTIVCGTSIIASLAVLFLLVDFVMSICKSISQNSSAKQIR